MPQMAAPGNELSNGLLWMHGKVPNYRNIAALSVPVYGQCSFLRDVLQLVCGIPQGLGAGFCCWESVLLPVPGSEWASPQAIAYMNEKGPGGNEWANQALFDYADNALPALEVIREFACFGE